MDAWKFFKFWVLGGGLVFSGINTATCWRNEADKTVQVEVWMPPGAQKVDREKANEARYSAKFNQKLEWDVYRETFPETEGQAVSQWKALGYHYQVQQGPIVFWTDKDYTIVSKGKIDKVNLIASAEGKEIYEVKLVRPNLATYFGKAIVFFAFGVFLTAGVTAMVTLACMMLWEEVIWPITRPFVSRYYRHRGWETPQRWEYY